MKPTRVWTPIKAMNGDEFIDHIAKKVKKKVGPRVVRVGGNASPVIRIGGDGTIREEVWYRDGRQVIKRH